MKIDDLLVEKIGENGFAAKKAAEKLKKEFYSVEFTVEKLELKNIKKSLIKIGKIIEENIDDCYYVAVVGAGVFNMNPAIVIVKLLDKKVKIIAYAKEGLIKQDTTKKAVDRVVKELKKYK